MNIDLNWNKDFAVEREGVVLMKNGNHKLYECPAGHMTIGHGHNLEAHGLPPRMATELLNMQLAEVKKECSEKVKGWESLNSARTSVLIDMNFNMGWTTLSKFKKFLSAVESGDYEKAAKEMKDSNWYRQVGLRAEILHKMMQSGTY